VVTILVPNVPGDAPAEGRLIVTDNAAKARRHVEWGLQQRYYDAATSLLIDSDTLVTTGYAGVQAAGGGGYDPDTGTNKVIQASLYNEAVAVCATASLTHVGTFRVRARVRTLAPTALVRAAWWTGDGASAANDWVTTPTVPSTGANEFEVNLGLVTFPAAKLGTQSSIIRIDAQSPDTTVYTLEVDYLKLIPVDEGYGRLSTPYVYETGVLKGTDGFTGTTAGGALNARVAPLGGTWATSGPAGDFTFADTPRECVTRGTISEAAGVGRLNRLGTATYTDVEVSSLFRTTAAGLDSNGAVLAQYGLVARYVSLTDFLEFTVQSNGLFLSIFSGGGSVGFQLVPSPRLEADRWYQLRLVCFASGYAYGDLLNETGTTILARLSLNNTRLATGGTHATGGVALRDVNTSSVVHNRYYDNFNVATPAPEPIAIHPSRSVEFRHDGVLRASANGTLYGGVGEYRGGPLLIPPAGDQNRTTRIIVSAHRSDLQTSSAVGSGAATSDSTTIEVRYRPRYLTVPGP
ncbi:MAG: hypothetical protein H0V18_06330, partial [Pyrinomonadaceae bacterium]|nr:hypothetical protein [Pyrinomonadaceae bacterium]